MQPWMTLGASLVAKVVDYTVAPLGNQLRYLYQYNKNAENLRKQAERLQEKTDDIQALVNYAKRNDREIKSTVKNWLEEVDEITAEIKSWDDKTQNLSKMCLRHLVSRYKQSKMATKKIMTIQELLGRTLTEDVSIPQGPPLNIPFISDQEKPEKDQVTEMVASSSSIVSQNVSITNGALQSKDDVSIEQRLTMDSIIGYQLRKNVANIIYQQREAVDQIIEELQDDHYKVIGIYGMGGIGKTTLAVEVGKLARDCGIVKRVIMVGVSQTPNIRKIQGLIADMLCYRFEEESTLGRAGRLYMQLSMESVLLILDDVWSYIDLAEIGIPHGDEHKACRIMLTTRQKDLCTAMGTKGVPLRLLSKEESSHLLRKYACTSTSDLCPELDSMVIKFVEECQGLPLALVTVGSALRGKEQVEWEAALQLLKKSQPFTPTYASKTIFSCLELSYNFLESEEIRLCFLMCCFYPEDHEISIEDLTRNWTGKGLFSNVDTIEEARARVFLRVGQLKSSCLLLDIGKEGFVKMHDVIRDFAIYKASEEKHGFMVRAGHNLNKWPQRESFSQKTAISFMHNNIHVLPTDVHCPNLQILHLGENEGLEQIPVDFFMHMKTLQVLDLSERVGVHSLNPHYQLVPNATKKNTFPLSFPSSVEVLTNLRTLRLDHCRLADVSILGKLKGLEILSLYGSSITQLPNEFGDLVNLRLLDLSFCGYLQKIPENLISRLVRLEELYMGWSFRLWQLADGSAEGSGQVSLSELMSLPQLNILCVEVSTLLAFPENFDLPSLHKFEITVGYHSAICYPNSRRFYLRELKTGIPNGMNHMLQFSNELTMFCASKVILKSIFDVEGGLNHLKTLEITANDDITYFIDEVLHSDAPLVLGSLEKLHLRTFKKLYSLSVHSIKPGSFQNLRILKVEFCHDLFFLLQPSLLQRLSSIEEVYVYSCNKLFKLFQLNGAAFDEEQKLLSTLKMIGLDRLPMLFEIWGVPKQLLLNATLQNKQCFNNLTDVAIKYCDSLKYVFPFVAAQNLCQLDNLQIVGCHRLTRITGEAPEGMPANVQNGHVLFANLRAVHIGSCRNLRNLFSVTTARSLGKLEELKVNDMPNLVELISNEESERREENDKIIVLPELKVLRITNSGNMERLCTEAFCMDLPSLEEFVLLECPKMADTVKRGLGSASNLLKAQIEEQSFFGTMAREVFSRKV
ncbi:probable disease resistance protein At4g27220 [Solanum lycopersicum]|uniref:probable disease resistance protein At4g27220 n=1 Tax=Solanum lycopersicum TaxID=4081 RepID=UPI0037493E66